MRITMSGGRLQHSVLVVVILFVLGHSVPDSKVISCIEEEREALLVFKQGLVDEYGYLSSWGKEDDKKNCCKWRGVQCDNQTGHINVIHLRASGLSPNEGLKGTISHSLLKLHHLSFLDLSHNRFEGIRIPEFIGSISKLKYLDLSYAGFGGAVPHQLGNLSRLQFLDLRENDNLYSVGNLEWLSHLSSLRYLDLTLSNFSKSSDWFQVVGKLPFLKILQLSSCSLPPIIPSSLSLINSTTSLEVLDLSFNDLSSSIYSWLFSNVSSNLVDLYLDGNLLQGGIPDAFGHMTTSLRGLSLNLNDLEGGIPKFFGNMCSLHSLDLSHNNLKGQLSGSIQNLLGECTKTPVEILTLDGNEFMGSMPDLTRFSSLIILNFGHNRLNGTLTKSIARLLKLEILMLDGNSLEGAISEAFLSNLSNLQVLDLADNSLALELSHDWIPPFQLGHLSLASCKIGPHFPKWLQTQKQLSLLDISNVGISDTVPDGFWDRPPMLYWLNLSHNRIRGRLPDLSSKFTNFDVVIDISSNHFEGPITTLPSSLTLLDMSRNKFLGTISVLCSVISQTLTYLDLSSNQLSGRVPDCWQQFPDLSVLNLANNGFSGNIPHSMGALSEIRTLSLRNNNFSGDLPSSLKNCTKLRVLDLGKNSLSGKIPAWIGDSLSDLIVLILQSNRFLGNIHFQLCNLVDIQILDLSLNIISGAIPECFSNFTVMTEERSLNATIANDNFPVGIVRFLYYNYLDSAMLKWKGHEYEYKNNLGLVKILDLSSNKLGGTIPGEIMSLVGLIALNLSRNNLTGQINRNIGQLQLLDFLDLSRNQFFGEIPSSLSLITRLSVLDLSNNNLSGKIPLGTQLQGFNASVYAGNPGLCGLPLPNKCPWEEPAQGPNTSTPEEKDQFITLGFYVSMVLGFVVGFWGVCGTLLLNNSWRHAYFNFLTSIKDWLHVTIAVTIARQRGRLT